MNSVEVRMVFKDAQQTEWMQRLDVFENFKVMLGGQMLATVDLKEGDTVEAAIVRLVKKEAENPDAKFRLIAAFVPGSPDGAWKDPSVKSVSTGQNWCLFDKYLASNGFVEARELVHA